MNKVVKLLLFLGFTVGIFVVLRTSTPSTNNFFILIKNLSLFLIFSVVFIFFIFQTLRHNPIKGPTIIKANNLKKILYLVLLFWWLTLIVWMLSDSLKKITLFSYLNLYQFLDLLDESISHIFMYLSLISMFMIGIMLEIERPVKKLITRLEYFIIMSLSLPIGAIFGLSLTEGRLSLFTSFPAMLIFTFLSIYLFKKHQLELKNRPWSLAGITMGISGSISFSTWGLVFKSFPEFFNYLK